MLTVAAHCQHPAAPGHKICCRCGLQRRAEDLWPAFQGQPWTQAARPELPVAELPGGVMVRLALCRETS